MTDSYEIYSETIPFNFMKYIIFLEGAIGVLFLVFFVMQLTGRFIPDEDAPAYFWLIMAFIMLGITAFLTTLTKLKISITRDTFRASFGFIKFETPLSNIKNIYEDSGSGLKYGGWGVRISKLKEGMALAYTSIGEKRVVLELKENKYKFFVFSTANPVWLINTCKTSQGAKQMDLFDHQYEKDKLKDAPLAARMRPASLDEFVGQEHIIGKGRVLRKAIEAGNIPSMILWGPPGCGKTTLAYIIANTTASHFSPVSAVSAGVADLRRIIEEAKERRKLEPPEDHPLHRRNPPLQQGPAGRRPALRRGRHRHPHRRHHGKPLLRGHLRRCSPAAGSSR